MSAAKSGGHPPFFANANVFALDPAEVFVPERIGFLHEDVATALGRLMAKDGQRDPIKVAPHTGKQKWKLVTGRHRLRGAELEGIEVWALEVNGDAADHADLEASENIHRRDFSPLERAKFVATMAVAAQERIAREHGNLSQHQLGAKARWDRGNHAEERLSDVFSHEADDAAAKMSAAYSWQESVADAFKLGAREIRRALVLHRQIVMPFPDLVEALTAHPLVGKNASQLAKIAEVESEALRREVIEILVADERIKAEDALRIVGLGRAQPDATPVAYQKYFNQVEGGWGRLGLPQQREFLPKLVNLMTTGLKREMRDLLNEELGDA